MQSLSKTKTTKLICITGYIGSGKTTVLNILKNQGFSTFCTDNWVHKIYEKNRKGYQFIRKNFGKKFLFDNFVNRNALKNEILSSKHQKIKLEKNMNALIYKKINNLRLKNELIFVELGTLLYNFEYFKDLFCKVIVVDGNKNSKKNDDFKKNCPVKKFSTKNVGNSPFIDKMGIFYVDFIVENMLDTENLKNEVQKILLFI